MDNIFEDTPTLFEDISVGCPLFSDDYTYADTQALSPSSSSDAIFESPVQSPTHENSQPDNVWMHDQIATPLASDFKSVFPVSQDNNIFYTTPIMPVDYSAYASLAPPVLLSQPVLMQQDLTKLNKPSPNSPEDDSVTEEEKAKRPQKKRKTLEGAAAIKTKPIKQQPKESSPRESDSDILGGDRLGLSRDELLNFSSTQFESYVRKLGERRDLTPQEKSELKRQRRLIKNRESAQASRQRKKMNMEQLEAKVLELENERQALKEQVAALTNVNTRLESELLYFRKGAVSSSFVADMVSRGFSFIQKPMMPTTAIPTHPNCSNSSSGLQAASLVMMVVLFSFGLLFPTFLSQRALPSPLLQDTIPNVLPIQNRIFQNDNFKPTSEDKDISDILQAHQLPLRRRHGAQEVEDSFVSVQEVESHTYTSVPPPKVVENIKFQKVTMTEQPDVVAPQPLITQSDVVISNTSQMLHFKPNTTYLLCQNVSQVIPSLGMSSSAPPMSEFPLDAYPPQIAFLIPPDVLATADVSNNGASNPSTSDSEENQNQYERAGSFLNQPDNPNIGKEQHYLEVTCSIVDISFLPPEFCKIIQNQPINNNLSHYQQNSDLNYQHQNQPIETSQVFYDPMEDVGVPFFNDPSESFDSDSYDRF